MEYMKNTLLKLYATGEADALLPVFSIILALSPQELKQCREGLANIKAVRASAPSTALPI